jgi:hypothetical protein
MGIWRQYFVTAFFLLAVFAQLIVSGLAGQVQSYIRLLSWKHYFRAIMESARGEPFIHKTTWAMQDIGFTPRRSDQLFHEQISERSLEGNPRSGSCDCLTSKLEVSLTAPTRPDDASELVRNRHRRFVVTTPLSNPYTPRSQCVQGAASLDSGIRRVQNGPRTMHEQHS